MAEQSVIHWAFLNREAEVFMLGEKVAYSFTCGDPGHTHKLECLWIWHDCTMALDPVRAEAAKHADDVAGWQPAGIAKHDLISIEPLHIEPSLFWPSCCGMHGFIRDGHWVGV